MRTHLKKLKIVRGNRTFRGLSNNTKHRFPQTGETVSLSESIRRFFSFIDPRVGSKPYSDPELNVWMGQS